MRMNHIEPDKKNASLENKITPTLFIYLKSPNIFKIPISS